MTAVDVAEPTPEATAGGGSSTDLYDPVTGLTADELEAITELLAQQVQIRSLGASRLLAARRPGAEAAVDDAAADLRSARAALQNPQAIVDRLQGDLDKCRAQTEQIQAVGEDADIGAQIDARSRRVACQQLAEELEERLRLALRATDPLVVSVDSARRALRTAQADLDSLDRAIVAPFLSSQGRATAAWRECLIHTGEWLERKDADTWKVLKYALEVTDYGDYVQRQAIAAYQAGVPRARSVAGDVQHLPNGQTVTTTPDGLHIVTDNGATAQGLASVPASPQGHGPTGAEVLAGLRSGAGWPEPPPAVTKAQEPRPRARGWWGLDGALDWASR